MIRGVYLFLLILVCPLVFSIGITPPAYEVDFEPNLKRVFQFRILDNDQQLKLGLKGDLAQFASLEQTTVDGVGTFELVLELPEKVEIPGKHTIFVSATETIAPGGMIGAKLAVNGMIVVNVPFEGKYINPPSLSISNTNVNEKTEAVVNVQSFGTEDIDVLYSVVDVFDESENKLVTGRTETFSLPSLHKVDLRVELDTTDFLPGKYFGKATVFFDGQSQDTSRASFKVGELIVKINNYTRQVFAGQINKFDIEVESGWNNIIEDLFVEVTVFDDGEEAISFTTVPQELNPWETKIITGFLDASSLKSGKYDIEMIAHYEGKTTLESGDLRIKIQESETSLTIVILVVGVALVILTNFLWLSRIKKKAKKKINRKKKTRQREGPYRSLFGKNAR